MTEDTTSTAEQPEPAVPMLTGLLQQQFGDAVLDHHTQHGDETVFIDREQLVEVCRFLRDDARCKFSMMIDLTAVDHHPKSPRFELVIHLKSLELSHRLRLKVPLEDSDPSVDTITELWAAVNWYERECHEMYGIDFKGHPDLRPLLLYSGFRGYPLRKDYEKGHMQPLVPMRPVQERYNYGEYFDPVPGTQDSD